MQPPLKGRVDWTSHVELLDFNRVFYIKNKDGFFLTRTETGLNYAEKALPDQCLVGIHRSSRSLYSIMDGKGDCLTIEGDTCSWEKEANRTEQRFNFSTSINLETGIFVNSQNRLLIISDGDFAIAEDGFFDEKFIFELERIQNIRPFSQLEKYIPAHFGETADEIEKFEKKVSELIAKDKEVKMYVGCGLTIRPGFLCIDMNLPKSSLVEKSQIANLFKFPLGQEIPISDNSVDFILSEDFIEHLPQKTQIGFLAESFRILKAGGVNRVNTPCLMASMKTHSNFDLGFEGMYTGEWEKWGHEAVLTKGMLAEYAKMIGYRKVKFFSKNESISRYHTGCARPKGDRAGVDANIFADLVK